MEKRYPNQDAYDEAVYAASSQYGVPVPLIKAIIARESEFNPRAYRAEPQIGDASRGLMQLLYGTARALGYSGQPDGLYDPDVAVDLGTKYLRDLVRDARAHGYGIDSAISAYNGGESSERPGDGKRTGHTTASPFINAGYVSWVMERMTYFAAWEAQKHASATADSSGPSATAGGATAGSSGRTGTLAVGALALGAIGAAILKVKP